MLCSGADILQKFQKFKILVKDIVNPSQILSVFCNYLCIYKTDHDVPTERKIMRGHIIQFETLD